MCLIIDKRKHKERKIVLPWQFKYKPKKAKEDIYCKKEISRNMFKLYRIITSSIRGFKWQPGTVYKTKLKYDTGGVFNIGEYEIGQGFHAYYDTKNQYAANMLEYSKSITAIIPKGSKYFLGTGGEIVSNKMKVII